MNNLLTGWTSCTLSELLESLESGSRPRGGVKGIIDGVPSLGGEHLTYNGRFDFNKIRYVPEEFAVRMTKGHIKKNDILIVKDGATTGKTAFVSDSFPFENAVVNEHVFICRPTRFIESKFLFRFLISEEGQRRILDNFQGSAQGGINTSFAPNTIVPLAPLNEQHRIVEKLDYLLAKVEAARERLERIPHILKRFRQAVLAAAVSGELTRDWRERNPDVEDAKTLYIKIQNLITMKYEEECRKAAKEGRRKPKDQRKNKKSRNNVGEIPELPETWIYGRLEELTYLVTDGTHRTPKYKSNGIPFLSVKNVRPFKIYDDDIKYISNEEYKEINSRCNPEKGDILYTKVGATFGYAAEIKLDYSFSIFVSLALIKPVEYFLSEYAEITMNSEIIFKQARERVSGIGTPDLHLIEIRDFHIPLPPLEEQKEIVKRVETLFQIAERVEARYQNANAQVDKLAQSILAKAFRGELVPQDPNDESAAALLEQIKAEKDRRESVALPKASGDKKQRRKGR